MQPPSPLPGKAPLLPSSLSGVTSMELWNYEVGETQCSLYTPPTHPHSLISVSTEVLSRSPSQGQAYLVSNS